MTKKELRAYIDANRHLFGTDTDVAIAKRLGITQSASYRARVRFGLPVYKMTEEERVRREIEQGEEYERKQALRYRKADNFIRPEDLVNIENERLLRSAGF